jgi:hypothetical protein
MPGGQTATVTHDDSKGRAIRRGSYSLEPLVSHKFTWRSVDSRGYRCLPISPVGEWNPWSTWCILKGTPHKRNTRSEWHPWSTWCILKGTSRKGNERGEWHPWSTWCILKGKSH